MNRQQRFGKFYLLIWTARLGILGLVITAAVSLDIAGTGQHRADVKQSWQAMADQLRLNLQAEILQNIQTVWGLAANVAIEPDIDNERFNELAPVIFRLAPALKNIGLAPDLVIRHVYPLQDNESALGLDLTQQSLPPEKVKALKENRRAVFTGPIDLVQGGQGLASRIPTFTENSDRFWGVISVILDLNKLYETADIAATSRKLNFTLSASADASDTDAIFYGTDDNDWTDPVVSTLRMPGTTWTVFAEPASGWPSAPEHPLIFRSVSLLISATIVIAVFWLTRLLLRDRDMQIRFWGLFEFAPIGVALFSAQDGRLIRANPIFHTRFGGKVSSIDFFEHGFNADGSPLPEPMQLRGTLHNTRRIDDIQVYYPAEAPSVAPVRLRGLELQNTDSDPVIWLITEDITEQKKVERMKNEFISTVSHELRTPLTSISGSLALLENDAAGKLPDSAKRMVSIAHRNSLQLTRLINDLLDIDKLVAGKMVFQTETHALPELVRESVENINEFAGARGVGLDLTALHDVQVRVDRQRLNQALNNLLSNAIKFSPGGSSVIIDSQLKNGTVRICVHDQGEGVPPDFRQSIFEKFSQADSSSRRKKGGTGLGLAITRELMNQMDGSVDYESTHGQGSTFWLELPVIQ